MLMIESNRFCLFSLGSAYVKFYLWSGRNLEMKNRVYAQRQTLVWTTNQVFPLFIVYCSFCLLKNLKVRASFIHENCFGQFLFAYFLFWEISLPIMELVLCRKNCHWTFFVCYPINKLTIFFFVFQVLYWVSATTWKNNYPMPLHTLARPTPPWEGVETRMLRPNLQDTCPVPLC